MSCPILVDPISTQVVHMTKLTRDILEPKTEKGGVSLVGSVPGADQSIAAEPMQLDSGGQKKEGRKQGPKLSVQIRRDALMMLLLDVPSVCAACF